jgi:hypothetical protein
MRMHDEVAKLRETWLYYADLFLFDHMQLSGLAPVPIRVPMVGFSLVVLAKDT